MKRTPLKRSTKPIKKSRSKPRPGRLKGKALENLRRDCFERDKYRCQHEIKPGIYVLGYYNAIYRCLKEVAWDGPNAGHMAHIVSRGAGGKDELPNVLTKCAYCHQIREHHEGNGGKIVPRKPGGADNGIQYLP